MSFVKTAYDIARKRVFFCSTSDTLKKVATLMHENNIGSILVKDKTKLIGIITVNDILRQVSKNSDSNMVRARDIMSSPIRTADKDLEVDELVEEFKRHKVSRMVLLEKNGEVAGIVRDIAVYKYFTFFKYDEEIKKRFSKEYLGRLY